MEMKPDELKPPYLPFQTFLSFLTELGGKPLPPQIDRSMMNSKSGTDQANLFAALKFFGLIDQDQRVQHRLEAIVGGDEEARKVAIGSMLRQFYPHQFEVSQRNGTEKQLADSVEEDFGYTGDTRRKAMTFFLHGARWAGIDLSPHFPVTRMGSGRPATPRPKRATKKRTPSAGTPTGNPPARVGDGEHVSVSLGTAGSVDVDVRVRWLELPDETFTNLRRIIKELRELGSGTGAEVAEDEEVSTS